MTKRACVDKYKGPFTLGVDVSKWQSKINWQKVVNDKQQIKFAFARIGDGVGVDDRFEENWKEIRKVGLIRGFYRYFRADRDGKTQAQLDLNLLSKNGYDNKDLPPVIDIEEGAAEDLKGGLHSGGSLPIDLISEECLEYLEELETHLKVRPMVYTGQAFHWWFAQARPDLAKKFAKYPLWIPSYSSCCLMPTDRTGKGFPWKQYTIWQYTAEGIVDGIGKCDMNKFRGTVEDLKRFVDGSHFK